MLFEVQLIKTRPFPSLSGVEMFDIMVNATHVAGRYFIFEGEVESLLSKVTVVATGVTEGTGDMGWKERVTHCREIFGIDLSDETPWYEIANNYRWIAHV